MERFIRYLYEYENEKRIRNVGFIKVETGCEETIVHLQAKGFHDREERELCLYLFYEKNGKLVVFPQGEMRLTSSALSWHLVFSAEDVDGEENYAKICGVLLENGSGRRMAATWDDRCIDVNKVEESKVQQKNSTKITRKDISKLPHCEWKLANNRFLMHGYNNYHYLILIEEGNYLKLGVPGIYHIKEAKCAEEFGFGEFISADDVMDHFENIDENEMFGYWCRPVRGHRDWE